MLQEGKRFLWACLGRLEFAVCPVRDANMAPHPNPLPEGEGDGDKGDGDEGE